MRPLSSAVAIVVPAVASLSLLLFPNVRARDASARTLPRQLPPAVAQLPEPRGLEAGTAVAGAPGAPATFALIAAGSAHTCALDAGGAAFCWGNNAFGQLGATPADTCREKWEGKEVAFSCALRPVPVDGGLRFTTLALGNMHTCGLTPDGLAYCWGDNTLGQLGVDSVPDTCVEGDARLPCSRKPIAVAASLRFTRLAAGRFHTCGLLADGSIRCWGCDSEGQLGTTEPLASCSLPGTPVVPCVRKPVPVAADFRAVALAAGKFHVCALAADSTAYCWGTQVSREGSGTPKPVRGNLRLREIAAGGMVACGLAADGVPYCWGTFYYPRGLTIGGLEPARGGIWREKADSHFESVTVGEAHMCGLAAEGQAYCWGSGNFGQLGVKAGISKLLSKERGSADPVAVAGGLRFRTIAAGEGHTCAITLDGAAYCWGANFDGQLGDGTLSSHDLPTPVATAQIVAARP